MIEFVLIALICAASVIYLIQPLTNKRWIIAIATILPLLSLGLYMLIGAPY